MALANLLNASLQTGGSTNSAKGTSSSYASTNGTAATLAAQQNAQNANASALAAWREAAAFNAAEAQKQREWQEQMANTQYQRSVKDMKAAGINPILAATAGFGTGAVGSGSSASMSSPNSFMAGAYADSSSASSSNNWSEGNSWNNGESGFLTFAKELGKIADDAIGSLTSAFTINKATTGGRAQNNGKIGSDRAKK